MNTLLCIREQLMLISVFIKSYKGKIALYPISESYFNATAFILAGQMKIRFTMVQNPKMSPNIL